MKTVTQTNTPGWIKKKFHDFGMGEMFAPLAVDRLEEDDALLSKAVIDLHVLYHYPIISTPDHRMLVVAAADQVTLCDNINFAVGGVVFNTHDQDRTFIIPDNSTIFLRASVDPTCGDLVPCASTQDGTGLTPLARQQVCAFTLALGAETDPEGTGGGPSSPTSMRILKAVKGAAGSMPVITLYANDGPNNDHATRKDNPHEVTAAQTGAVPLTALGVPDGVATLGADGLLLTSQRPLLPVASNSGGGIVAAMSTAAEVAAGTISTKANSPAATALLRGHGECRLILSGENIVLQRVGQGRMLIPGGAMVQIPVGGISLPPTGSTPATLHFIYLSESLTLEYSLTVPVAEETTGIMIKTGDATRVLVGMAWPTTGPAWTDTLAQRFIRSYYNRKVLTCTALGGGSMTTYSQTPMESVTQARFLAWDDEYVVPSMSGYNANDTTGCTCFYRCLIDGTSASPLIADTAGGIYFACNSSVYGFARQINTTGLHTAGINFWVGSGLGTMHDGYSVTATICNS